MCCLSLLCPPPCPSLTDLASTGPTPAGMAFQSGVAEVGSGPHLALTWLVAIVLVTCIALFVSMLAMEVWRSIRFAHQVAVAKKASSSAAKVGGETCRVCEWDLWLLSLDSKAECLVLLSEIRVCSHWVRPQVWDSNC